ncbi:hypothetical protein JHK82_039837 [Glycine max]|nr:hypothetical protein JHK86_040035 [Glycine max]KAG4965637.1 hypothetical protein JHK85_040612 [Glycine max]KAG5110614.1 hypothetical protein JHK82_039837 [Glycine max]
MKRTFHSLKPPLRLPLPNVAVSAASFVLCLRCNSLFLDSSIALIDSTTGHRLSYGELLHRAKTLASNLTIVLKLTKGDTALVLSPNILQVPILYFALLSLGVVVSPASPLCTCSEMTRFFNISNPTIVFTVTSIVEKTRHLGAIVLSEMVVVMESFSLKAMLGAMERKETKKAFKAMLPNILVIQIPSLADTRQLESLLEYKRWFNLKEAKSCGLFVIHSPFSGQ